MSKLGNMGLRIGFFEGLNKNIEERKSYIQEKVAAAREQAQKSAERLQTRRAKADEALATAKSLQTLGFTDAQVKGIISMGPDAISTTLTEAQKALTAKGATSFTPSEAETFIRMPPELRVPEGPLSDFVYESYGAATPAETTKPQKPGFLEGLFGDADKEVERQLSQPEYGGASVKSINDAAAGAEYKSIAPGAVVIPPKTEKAASPLQISSAYTKAKRDYMKEYEDSLVDSDGTPLFGEEAAAAKQKLEADAEQHAKSLIAETYGEDALKYTSPQSTGGSVQTERVKSAIQYLLENNTPEMQKKFDEAMKKAGVNITAAQVLQAATNSQQTQ